MEPPRRHSRELVFVTVLFAALFLALGLPSCGDGGRGDPLPDPRLLDPDREKPPDAGGVDQEPPACLRDRVQPAGERCTCTCKDCDCTELDCRCENICYVVPGSCAITVGPSGNGTLRDGGLEGVTCGTLSCAPENDLSTELQCSLGNCEIEPNVLQLSPAVETAPSVQSFDRRAANTGMLFTVDTSSSMENKQMASACAMPAFFAAAQGAEYSIGISTMDVNSLYSGSSWANTAPHLVGLEGTCAVPQCNCGGSYTGGFCSFNAAGRMHHSSEPGVQDTLRKLLVQGGNEASDRDEGGLEKAFRHVFENIKAGNPTAITQVVAISDEEGDSDARLCPIQAARSSATDLAAMRAVLGADFAPPANTGNCITDLINFYKYFFQRYKIQVNTICDTTGSLKEKGAVYMEVAAATGGAIGDMRDCAAFSDFFRRVGVSTQAFSTQICLASPADPATLVVTYTQGGAGTTVPQSTTEGWSYDATRNCIHFHGSWEQKLGTYSVTAPGGGGVTGAKICFPGTVNPVPSSIRLKHQGTMVPPSGTDGWTYDPKTRCIQLHGSWASRTGPFDVEYL